MKSACPLYEVHEWPIALCCDLSIFVVYIYILFMMWFKHARGNSRTPCNNLLHFPYDPRVPLFGGLLSASFKRKLWCSSTSTRERSANVTSLYKVNPLQIQPGHFVKKLLLFHWYAKEFRKCKGATTTTVSLSIYNMISAHIPIPANM